MGQVLNKLENLTLKTIVIGTVIDPPLYAIDVLSDGDLVVQDIEGNEATYTFNDDSNAVHSHFPYRLEMRVRLVVTAGTTIGVNDLIGLH